MSGNPGAAPAPPSLRSSPELRRFTHTWEPVAYDCVKLIFVRSGSAILFSEFGQKPVNVGDVVVLGANTLCGSSPEGHITVTTIYADTDYVVDQVYWQHMGMLQDRLDAQDSAATIYAEPAQILRVGEATAGMLMPWLDELVALSIDGRFVESFHRMQALWSSVAHVVAPFVKTTPIRTSATQRATTWPTLPRHRRFAPLRTEAREAAELLRLQPERRWSVSALASAVHLSRSQVGRVFVEAYGKSPIAYLTMLRAERVDRWLPKHTDTQHVTGPSDGSLLDCRDGRCDSSDVRAGRSTS
jgi:AraC family transcriptional regulator